MQRGIPGVRLRWISGVAIAGIALGVGLSGQSQEPTRKGAGTAPRGTPAAEAEYIVAHDCLVNIIDRVTLAAARNGVLALVQPRVGDEIKQKQVIAKVRDEVAAAQLNTARMQSENDVEVRYADAAAKVDVQEYNIAVEANRKIPNTFSQMEIERKELQMKRSSLMIEQAKYQLDIEKSKRDEAQAILDTHSIEAPFSGTVTEVLRKTGEGVGEGMPILVIANTDRMRVEGYVPYRETARIGKGDLVKVRLDIKDQDLPQEKLTFEGYVTFIDLKVEQGIQGDGPVVKIHAEVLNQNGILKDSLQATMAVYPGRKFQKPAAAAAAGQQPAGLRTADR